jgi:NAD-dependent DNA ligase
MKIVFTGPATIGGERVARNLLVDIAVEHGHVIQSMVDGSTDYVVASSPDFLNRNGRKLKKAYEIGARIISPDEFLRMMEA